MCTSHSVMEGQRHNNLTRVAFIYNGPKGMKLAPKTHIIVEVAKALGGSFKLVTPAPKPVGEMTQLPREHEGWEKSHKHLIAREICSAFDTVRSHDRFALSHPVHRFQFPSIGWKKFSAIFSHVLAGNYFVNFPAP